MSKLQREPSRLSSVRLCLVLGLCAGWSSLVSCASGPQVCREDPVYGSTQCQSSSSDPAEAVVTAGIAAGAWGVVGCTVNGCEPPYRCNTETKQCERIRCDENKSSCPPSYTCDPIKHVCL